MRWGGPLLVAAAAAVLHADSPSLAGCPVLPADNVWNTPVDNLPADRNSALYVQSAGPTQPLHPDFGTGLIGIPYVAVRGDQPPVQVQFSYADESDPGPYPIPPDAPIEGGAAAKGDRHVLVLDRDRCVLYELFNAAPIDGGRWKAGSGAIFDLKSNALRPAGWTSADAAGLPIVPGLVRFDEVLAGEIRHAIRFTVQRTRRAFLWPARHYASSLTDAQYPPMGQRFRLKASVDISGFSPRNQVILRALKKYGMILADNGSNWYITGAPDGRWDNDELHQLARLQGADFEAVDESSLMVRADSGQARAPRALVGMVNAASFSSGAVAPGEIVSLFGSYLGPADGATGAAITTRVLFDGIPAPVLYAQFSQVNAVVPYGVAKLAGTQVQVEYDGGRTEALTVPVSAAAPGIFGILNQDYSLNSDGNPAAAGSVILIFATGAGETSPAGVDGKIAAPPDLPAPVLPVSVNIGDVLYAGAAPGLIAGVLQVNVRLSGGTSSVRLKVGEAVSPPGAMVFVR